MSIKFHTIGKPNNIFITIGYFWGKMWHLLELNKIIMMVGLTFYVYLRQIVRGGWWNENWPRHLPKLDPLSAIKIVPWFSDFLKMGYWFFVVDPFIYQNLGLRRDHSFTRGVKMGPFLVAHPPIHLVTWVITYCKFTESQLTISFNEL